MATIEKRVGRRSVSYRITVSDGYDGNYKKIRHRKTWRVPDGWSEKRAEKEVQKVALEFEQKIRQGSRSVQASSTTRFCHINTCCAAYVRKSGI